MQTTQEIYQQTISPLPDAEKLELASMILQNLTAEKSKRKVSAVELLNRLPAQSIFKSPTEADEFLREERDSWER